MSRKQPDPKPTPPRKKAGRPPGEPREPVAMRLPIRVREMIAELTEILPTHPNGKAWTQTDVVSHAVWLLWRDVKTREAAPQPGRTPGTSG